MNWSEFVRPTWVKMIFLSLWIAIAIGSFFLAASLYVSYGEPNTPVLQFFNLVLPPVIVLFTFPFTIFSSHIYQSPAPALLCGFLLLIYLMWVYLLACIFGKLIGRRRD